MTWDQTRIGRAEARILRRASAVVSGRPVVAEVFEPNVSFAAGHLDAPFIWIRERIAIGRGGVASWSLWVITDDDHLHIFVIRWPIFGWRVGRRIGSWPLSQVSARRISPASFPDGDWAMEVFTPVQRLEVKAVGPSEPAQELIRRLVAAGCKRESVDE